MKKIESNDIRKINKDLRALLSKPLESKDTSQVVEEIIKHVRANGDHALKEYIARFDGVRLRPDEFKVSKEEIASAVSSIPDKIKIALENAASTIQSFHLKQRRQEEWSIRQKNGLLLHQITRPIQSVGIYIPGGRHPYPSTVLMAAIPAKVAGVPRVVAVTPPRKDGSINPLILYACKLVGVEDIYRVGGAQAVAALAFGTDTIPKVTKIVGPGNKYVAMAKLIVKQHYGVDIDVVAGPSEIMIIADETADPLFIAYDLLSQAEHDPDSVSILLTPSRPLIEQVERKTCQIMSELNQISSSVEDTLSRGGFIVHVPDLADAIDLANNFAPEHLEIITEDPTKSLAKIQNAGAVTLGPYSTVPITDYGAGLNHILPTNGHAKTRNGLTTHDFLKLIGVLEADRDSIREFGPTAIALAEAEGLVLHGLAISARLKEKNRRDTLK
ncbi:MAG: histidinol dehydrogenase [Candidatus Ranarchaeia archaeon]